MKKILFVTSEAYPLIKTGGLADVSGSLPIALQALGHDVRILMPGYPAAVAAGHFKPHRQLHGGSGVAILEGGLPDADVPVWLLTHKDYFDREGNPYLDAEGKPWDDNPQRFALLCHVAVEVAMNRMGLHWKPDIVHCNDWQTGLIPPLLSDEPGRPASVFTIHNLAYQGLFPYPVFEKLRLPQRFWSPDGLEFYQQLCFIKGGLVFADRINTVSPNYAREICSPEFGCGLDGLLQHRADRLSGILNGIDPAAWNPATDPFISARFDSNDLAARCRNKAVLQQQCQWPADPAPALMAWVGRLVKQKGIDLLIELLPGLMQLPVQLVVVGTGEGRYERLLQRWAQLYPERIAFFCCYDEPLAHQVEAGSDLFLMPSRFEPCGLTQMYSQRYGSVPVVRRVGGLADTVTDADPITLGHQQATGIVFDESSADSLRQAIQRGLALFCNKPLWQQIQQVGMSRDFSWEHSARRYESLYDQALADSHLAESLLRTGQASG